MIFLKLFNLDQMKKAVVILATVAETTIGPCKLKGRYWLLLLERKRISELQQKSLLTSCEIWDSIDNDQKDNSIAENSDQVSDTSVGDIMKDVICLKYQILTP